LAFLSGGGWGAYHYYGSDLLAGVQPTEQLVAAHSAPTPKDELKLLFASEEKTASPVKKTAQVDRYASVKPKPVQLSAATPELPRLAVSKNESKNAESKNPRPTKANPQQPVLGNRYATAFTSRESPEIESSISEPPSTEPKSDVARGQERRHRLALMPALRLAQH